jgi:hypothetical protein
MMLRLVWRLTQRAVLGSITTAFSLAGFGIQASLKKIGIWFPKLYKNLVSQALQEQGME